MTNKDKEREVKGIFDDAEVIHSYTRAEAIADGVLVDVTKLASETGFRLPVALTRAVWERYVVVPDGVSGQDETGRLWDVLWMTHLAAKRFGDRSTTPVELYVRNSDEAEATLVTLKAMCHPGDSGEPVVTILLPDED